jgi:hypothetical protein
MVEFPNECNTFIPFCSHVWRNRSLCTAHKAVEACKERCSPSIGIPYYRDPFSQLCQLFDTTPPAQSVLDCIKRTSFLLKQDSDQSSCAVEAERWTIENAPRNLSGKAACFRDNMAPFTGLCHQLQCKLLLLRQRRANGTEMCGGSAYAEMMRFYRGMIKYVMAPMHRYCTVETGAEEPAVEKSSCFWSACTDLYEDVSRGIEADA